MCSKNVSLLIGFTTERIWMKGHGVKKPLATPISRKMTKQTQSDIAGVSELSYVNIVRIQLCVREGNNYRSSKVQN